MLSGSRVIQIHLPHFLHATLLHWSNPCLAYQYCQQQGTITQQDMSLYVKVRVLCQILFYYICEADVEIVQIDEI